jgi:hypothetical protein
MRHVPARPAPRRPAALRWARAGLRLQHSAPVPRRRCGAAGFYVSAVFGLALGRLCSVSRNLHARGSGAGTGPARVSPRSEDGWLVPQHRVSRFATRASGFVGRRLWFGVVQPAACGRRSNARAAWHAASWMHPGVRLVGSCNVPRCLRIRCGPWEVCGRLWWPAAPRRQSPPTSGTRIRQILVWAVPVGPCAPGVAAGAGAGAAPSPRPAAFGAIVPVPSPPASPDLLLPSGDDLPPGTATRGGLGCGSASDFDLWSDPMSE